MKELTLYNWIIEHDPDATLKTYRMIESGCADTCLCASCKHYSKFRKNYLNEHATQILLKLGIDKTKEAEVYFTGDHKSFDGQFKVWFHFIGSIKSITDINHSSDSTYIKLTNTSMVSISELCEMPNPIFNRLKILQISFILLTDGSNMHI